MKTKFSRVGLLFLVITLALAAMGVGYSMWDKSLTISGTVSTGEVDWELTDFTIQDYHEPPLEVPDFHCRDGFEGPAPHFWPDPEGKNVGWGTGEFEDGPDADGDMSIFRLTLHEMYPCYFNVIGVYAHNNGTVPLIMDHVIISSLYETHTLTASGIVALDLDGDGFDDVEIWWKDGFGVQLEPCDNSDEMSFWIHILQAAPQGATHTFTIEIVGVQWNECL